jgi:hypothetical protein
MVFPSSSLSFGFGSNKSTCDGPPAMKRKMMRLARGAKFGTPGSPPDASKSGFSNDASASAPRPPAERPRNALRVSEVLKAASGVMAC